LSWNLGYGQALDDPRGAEMTGFSVVDLDMRPRLAFYALQAMDKANVNQLQVDDRQH
jgi:hypothetical protein